MPGWGIKSYGGHVTGQGKKGEAQNIRDTLVASGHDADDIKVVRTDPPSKAAQSK
jgi:hypothetical protein